MDPSIILAGIVLVTVAVLMFFRINATLVFLSLCLGNILVQFVAPDANDFFDMFTTKAGQSVSVDNPTIKVILLLLPVVLTAVFMIRTVRGHGKLLLNLLPAIGTAVLGALLIVPLLPAGVSGTITSSTIWQDVLKFENLVVGTTALVCLFVLWLQRPKTGHDEKHGKHKG